MVEQPELLDTDMKVKSLATFTKVEHLISNDLAISLLGLY